MAAEFDFESALVTEDDRYDYGEVSMVAMGYVSANLTATGTALYAGVRGKFLPVTVAALPFVANTFKR